MSLTLIVTNAGRAALVNAANTGTAPVTIASCGVSPSAVVPAATATALPGEIKRIATLSGDVVADDTIHLIVRDEGADAFTLRSFGLYLADGTLFAIYGQALPILEKTAQSIMLLAVDVRFADVAATALTFGNANFLNPPATTEQIGVVELATLAEQLAGTDTQRVPAAKIIKDAVFSWLDARFGANNSAIWHPGNDGAGSGLDADLLDGQHGSYYTAIAARLGYTPANKAGDTFTGPLIAPNYNLTLPNAGYFLSNGNPLLAGDFGDYYQFDRAGNSHNLVVGDVLQAYVNSSGFLVSRVGFNAGGNVVWHAGNDGSGSGLDADLLDGQHGSYYSDVSGRLGYVPANRAGDTFTGKVGFQGSVTGNSDLGVSAGALGEIEIRGNGVGAAMMAFHRPGSFAGYLGLSIDNQLRWGGWSLGAVAHLIWHSGNDGSGSGMDADLLDGQDGSYYGNIPARLGYTPANRAGDFFSGDITVYRSSAPSQGVVYFGSAGGRYLYYNGSNYEFGGAPLFVNGGQAWTAANDGSGSGLDADLLDGYHASDFDRIVEQNLTSNGGYIIYASGRKETWGRLVVPQDSYGTWYLPIAHGSWVHPSFAYTGKSGVNNTGDNTMISAINGAPPVSITIYNAEDTTVTVYLRTIGS